MAANHFCTGAAGKQSKFPADGSDGATGRPSGMQVEGGPTNSLPDPWWDGSGTPWKNMNV
jgi:hypothetical protein